MGSTSGSSTAPGSDSVSAEARRAARPQCPSNAASGGYAAIHRPEVKFCGITRPEDAALAADLGAWAVGIILWPGRPRVRPGVAAGIARTLRRRVEIAGVFVNATLDHVAELADAVGLSLVQLHGDEGPEYCGEIARRTGAA